MSKQPIFILPPMQGEPDRQQTPKQISEFAAQLNLITGRILAKGNFIRFT
jgi:hypothetical protein